MQSGNQIKEAIYKKTRKPVVVVRDFQVINMASSELLADTLRKLKTEGKVLIIADDGTMQNKNLLVSVEGLDEVSIISIKELESKDVASADYLVITQAAINEVSERLSKQ